MQEELFILSGSIATVTYRNEETGFAVLLVSSDKATVTVTGTLSSLNAGDEVEITGNWICHKVYGKQFSAKSFVVKPPSTVEGIYRYLTSGAVKGIGPATAEQIISKFGQNSLKVIEHEPERLAQIKGISLEKAKKVSENYLSQNGLRTVIAGLSPYGITPVEASEIYNIYGADAVDIIRANPYIICHEPLEMRFDTAERIAHSEGISRNDTNRVISAVLYVLRHNLSNGHTCIPREKLISVVAKLADVDFDAVDIAIDALCDLGETAAFESAKKPYVALTKYYNAEKYIATRMKLMLEHPFFTQFDVESEITAVEKKLGIRYEQKQFEAIRYALSKGLVILTGGPGTGKTTTLCGLIDILEKKGLKVALAAPTGRAAKRMEELTGKEAKTIHRLLEVQFSKNDKPYFAKNENHPISADVVIIDEISMVDTLLFEALLRAMNMGCRLVLVGDVCQLPSVSAGNVLSDLIDCKKIPTVTLESIFRQAKESAIVTNAHRIVNGQMYDRYKKSDDFFFMYQTSPQIVSNTVAELCLTRLKNAYGYDAFSDIQVLCPSKKLRTGTADLNNILQNALNPAAETKAQLNFEEYCLRAGDKVMQTKNNYEIEFEKDSGEVGAGIFNGDIGIITKIDGKNLEVSVKFDDRTAKYTFDETKDLELAYAITVHKSQGNEYPCVIIPLCAVPSPLCFRNLIYTAVTRAKERLIIIGNDEIMKKMVENDRKTLRYTALKNLLIENI